MSDVNLLFLSPHWRVTLVRAFQDSWKRWQAGGRLIGADSDEEAGAINRLPWSHRLPLFTDPACIEALTDICKRESIHAVVPLTNKAIDFVDSHRKALEKLKLHLYLAPHEAVEACHDKLKLAERFVEGRVTTPRTWTVDAVPEDAAFPLIAKPRFGEGSKNVFVLEAKGDLDYYAAKFPDHAIQEWIEGPEYSIDWFAARDRDIRIAVPRQRLVVRGGEVMKSRIEMKPALIDAARIVAETLGIRGPATIQGIVGVDGAFRLTDVNLRFGSGYVHTIAAGADVPLLMHRELSGGAVDEQAVRIVDGSTMVRFPDHVLL